MADNTRTLPPPLEHHAPACSICGKETSWEDGQFGCYDCGAWWDEKSVGQNEPGAWGDDEEQQCRWAIQPHANNEKYPDLQSMTFRCVLADGHDQAIKDDEHIGLVIDVPASGYIDVHKWHNHLLKYVPNAKAWQVEDESDED